MTAFAQLLGLLAEVADPRRAQGQLYKLPHVLLFAILAIVTGCNSYRGIVTFIDVHRHRLNAAFGLNGRRAAGPHRHRRNRRPASAARPWHGRAAVQRPARVSG